VIALDAPLLAYAINRYAPEHRRAAEVVEELVNGDVPWALPWPAAHAFLSLVTHPHRVARALKPSEAWSFLGPIVASPAVRLLGPTGRHATVLVEVLGAVGGTLPAGLETAVVLREHGVRELLTTDRGMRRYPFLSVRDPLREPDQPLVAPLKRYRRLRPGRS
jgi:predicted nucleic acid-binding protein